jgi:hypothetical protein
MVFKEVQISYWRTAIFRTESGNDRRKQRTPVPEHYLIQLRHLIYLLPLIFLKTSHSKESTQDIRSNPATVWRTAHQSPALLQANSATHRAQHGESTRSKQ